VPEKFKTKEICFIAVKNNGNALKYVDIDLLTAQEYTEICKLAFVREKP